MVRIQTKPRIIETDDRTANPLISVIIATRNRADDLEKSLPTVLANDYPNFEVIVVDQTPDDSTQQVLQHHSDPRLRHYHQEGAGKERAQNLGLELAQGDVLAFTDDDCAVPADWLTRGRSVLEKEAGAGIAYGKVIAVGHDPAEVYIPKFLPKRYRRFRGWYQRAHRSGIGANMFVRRQVFQKAGAFETRLGPGSRFRSGGDWELSYRALGAGFDVVQDIGNVVTHWGARRFAGGEVRQLISNFYIGIGAGYSLHIRRGDLRALYLLSQEVVLIGLQCGWNLVRLRRPIGVRRLLSLLKGAGTALWSEAGRGSAHD